MKNKIYLLPGTMCDERLWKNITPLLNKEFQLIHINIPVKNSLDEICEEILYKIEDERINLIGFSLGAYIASYFASKFPNRISKLMLLSNSACSLSNLEIKTRTNLIKQISSFGLKELSKKRVLDLLSKENQNNEKLILLIQNMYSNLGKETLLSQLKATLNREDLFDYFLSFSFPVLFSYSKNDVLVNHTWINKLKQIQNKIEFVEFEGSSHMLPLEKPKEISALTENFLTR